MKRTPQTSIFKPTPSRMEARSDATTRAAREIIDREVAVRVAKTDRLRAARLSQTTIEPPKPKKARRKG